LDPIKLATGKKEFESLEKQGIIRRSNSNWSLPLHMVKKPDGSWRPCGDKRWLNLITKPDRYTCPNISDLTARLAGSTIYTKLDLRKGYHQVPVGEQAIGRKAIVTQFGTYEYLRMPFALRNAGQTFQQMMGSVMAGLPYCFIYMDDVLVASASPEQHLEHLQKVLQRLQQHGLVKFAQPRNVGHLQTFLGMANFYRQFIPAAAQVLKPLTDQVKGGQATLLEWTPEMINAFQQVKNRLCNAAELVHPEEHAEVFLAVDDSNTHVGAVLQQRACGQSARPLAFFSVKLVQPRPETWPLIGSYWQCTWPSGTSGGC
jgi:hypothetical protein